MRILAALVTASISVIGACTGVQAQLVSVETVPVGDAGNAADTNGFGSVADAFAIGRYEVTIGQYSTFLNSVASVSSNSYIVNLWNPSMASNLNVSGVSRSGAGTLGDPYSYSVVGSGNRPITYVSWFDAARFANWLNNGATNGASTETGAYSLNGATNGIFTVNPGSVWFLPSEDQWYKAAYYRGGGTNAGYWTYPTQSDVAPGNTIGGGSNQANYFAGDYAVTQSPTYSASQNYLTEVGAFSNSPSAYGTFDQGGNVTEWNDAVTNSSRGMNLSAWNSGLVALASSDHNYFTPATEGDNTGFRVATVPEPSTYALLLIGAGALYTWKRRRSA